MGACAACTKTINLIIQTSHKAPVEVQSLNNELNESFILLARVEESHRKAQNAQASVAVATGNTQAPLKWDEDLIKILDRAQKWISKLEKFLNEVATAQSSGRTKLVFLWLKRQDDVIRYKDNIKQLRADLQLLLSTHILDASSRIELSVTEISLQSANIEQSQKTLINHTTHLTHTQSQLQASVDQLSKPTQTLIDKQDQILQNVQDLIQIFYNSSPNITSASFQNTNSNSTSTSTYFKVTAKAVGCSSYCLCACHRRSSISTPAIFRQILGFLFIGYVGSPVFKTTKCTQKKCKGQTQSSIHVIYYFPTWWMNRVLVGAANVSNQGISNARLTTHARLRMSPETIMWGAAWNDLERIKLLLQNRMARPNDMDYEGGVSALNYAVVNSRPEVCQFLLQWGADPNLKNDFGMTPAQNACSLVLGNKNPSPEIRAIAELFDINDYIEQEEFTYIHKIVFQVAVGSLDEQLQCSTSSIDVPDASGRTPIWWAASRGDIEQVKILIHHGADLDTQDKRGHAALHRAAENGHLECVQALLAAGANHNVRDLTGALPLSVWAWGSFEDIEAGISIGRSLIQAGTDPNIGDQDQVTPLMNAASYDAHHHARFLLENGADPDKLNRVVEPALKYAVEHNGHEVLKVLHEYGAKCFFAGEYVNVRGEKLTSNILHTAAETGDLETLKVLELFAENLCKLDPNEPGYADEGTATALELAAKREDIPGFLDAFKNLLKFLAEYKEESGKVVAEHNEDKPQECQKFRVTGINLSTGELTALQVLLAYWRRPAAENTFILTIQLLAFDSVHLPGVEPEQDEKEELS
ncbi:hypothetical protein TWF970_000743 [Orbilia oligospora]|uniref:Uncharacterized protein n=1 Tax=Orbilia oligospora TaxID=2813651 RepID=A0A7C8RP34_ORBOL|nr:hypothetical protein TWF970_000743 [Orbilia oligospora]